MASKQIFTLYFNVEKKVSSPYETPKWELVAAMQKADIEAYTHKQAIKHHAYEVAKHRFPDKIHKGDTIRITEVNPKTI